MEKKAEERIAELKKIKETALMGGGQKRIDRQHQMGKMSARERIDYLLDKDSFVESYMVLGHYQGNPAEGIVSGHGTINGQRICIYSQDATVKGGSIGALHGLKMYKTVERALKMRVPVIGLHDSPGARLQDISEAKTAMGDVLEKSGGSVFFPNTMASGVVPQIACIMGSCAGISVYSPALFDFIFMVDKQSHMFITGPAMVKTVLGEDLTADELGGAAIHCKKSGVADKRFPDEKALLDGVKDLVSYLPPNTDTKPPIVEMNDNPNREDEKLADIVPATSNKAFDVHRVVKSVVDDGQFFEVKPEFAGEIVVGFGRLDNKTVGIVANQCIVKAGSMTVDSSDKQTRFMRFCDSFNIPIILLVDTPAYLPGRQQEHSGIIRHGAKVLYALCEATVPRIVVVIRKSYGGGNLGMGIVPGMGTDMVYYWPIVEVGVLGAEASVNLFFGKEIMAADNPEEIRAKRLKEYSALYANPLREVSANWAIEDVIDPKETRKVLINALKLLASKDNTPHISKRHGNIPL